VSSLPRFISVDDHVVEPADLWTSRLPAKLRDRGPQVRREKGVLEWTGAQSRWIADAELPGARWADVWHYEDLVQPLIRGLAADGYVDEDPRTPITYEEFTPGVLEREARIEAMDRNHTDVSVCFPNVIRFCGQWFLEGADKEVARLGVQAYNDWMIDEWCGTARPTRLVPLTLVPMWDGELAAEEVRRCADKGSHAIAFSENPTALGQPSIFSDFWDPMFAACQETDTVINVHVGSSSRLMTTADDSPSGETLALVYVNAQLSFTDWIFSGVFEEFPRLKVVMSESQVGWMPFAMQRVDNSWAKTRLRQERRGREASRLPSSSVPGHLFGTVFDDLEGLVNRAAVGIEQIMIETDYPHPDSTFPRSEEVVGELVAKAGMTDAEIYKLTRGNAIAVYGLDRYFGIDR
jgi:predicted TIM-barrel fold metal-dependent hydrolase